MKIAVVGLWHLGEVVSVGLAELGHTVLAIDGDKKVVDNLKKAILPLPEKDVATSIAKHIKNGSLSFSTDFGLVKDCEVIFLTHDTPVDENDEPDISGLQQSTKKLARYIKNDALFVVMSQIPVGTTKRLFESIKKYNLKFTGETVYFPENLQLGKALECFLFPERVVVGAETESAFLKLNQIITLIKCPRFKMSIASAEITKHALNSFLATSLSFIYDISDVCEMAGGDITDVAKALRSDKRIGQAAYLDSSLGFSGGTLMRDLRILSGFAKKNKKPLAVIDGVLQTNINRRKTFIERLQKLLKIPLHKAKIGILGITYKPGTSTLRRSLALELVVALRKEKAGVQVFDPQALELEFQKETGLQLSQTVEEAARGCHALLLVTAWPEFSDLPFKRIKEAMLPPFLFLDTRNFLKSQEKEIKEAGFLYCGIGR